MVIIGMNKSIIILGALFSAIFIVSTSTAVPLINKTYFINKINDIEDIKTKLQNKIFEIDEFISKKIDDLYTLGFIENLINLLIKLLEFILNIANFISRILNIGSQILFIVNQIIYIIETTINIINWLIDIFNPQKILTNN
jgi:hypothetical protein